MSYQFGNSLLSCGTASSCLCLCSLCCFRRTALCDYLKSKMVSCLIGCHHSKYWDRLLLVMALLAEN